MAFVAAINILDVKVDTFNINPSTQTNYITLYLSYPSLDAKSIQLMDVGAGYTPTNLPLLSVEILLAYDGYLTEKKEVTVKAFGIVYGDGKKEIWSCLSDTPNMPKSPEYRHNILIGFEGASPSNESQEQYNLNGEFVTTLNEASNDTQRVLFIKKSAMKDLPIPSHSMTWETQGDYYPYITVYFLNGTSSHIPYSNYKIHVNTPDIERQDRYSRINTSLTIVLFFLSLLASIELLTQLFPKYWLNKLGTGGDSEYPKNSTADQTQKSTEEKKSHPEKSDNPSTKQK